MKIVVIGSDGQLGCDLLKLSPDSIGLTIKDLDVTNAEQSRKVLTGIKPQVIINTAAFHRVDDCEDHPDRAFAVNALGAGNLARICRDLGASLVYISTDYVFDGTKGSPYREADTPNPVSAYGISKLAGELMVSYILPRHYIVRTCGLFGAAGCLEKGGTNFIEGMIKRAGSGQPVKVVDDEIVGPTYTHDLAGKILDIIKTSSYGIYHITNSGQCSWYEFTLEIFKLIGSKIEVKPVSGAEFKAKAKRPAFSVLEHDQLKRLGLNDMRSWQAALGAYLREKNYIK